MNLKQKSISGLFWTFSQQFSVQLINFAITIILARILTPAEFGLIAMLSIFIALGNSLMDSGLTSSLIRTPDADQKDYSTIFFFNLIGSIVIYFILFFIAPSISRFYHQAVLTDIVRVYSLSFILSAFVGVQSTRLTKKMDFRTQMIIQIPSVVGGGVLGVVLANLGYGVWSLVWMNLLQSFLFTIQHWIYSGWRPDFLFDKERFKLHFNFGYKMTLSGLLETFYQNLYTLIIGKFYSAIQLGFYSRALSTSQLPVGNISVALNKVTYPMFSSISHDNEKLKMAYKKLMQQVIFWIAPILIFLLVNAEPLFRFLLTDKWLPAVPYFQILCIAGILQPLQSYNLNILKVKGRSDLIVKLEIIKKIYCTIGIVCAVYFGIYGLLYFQVISAIIDYYINSYFSGKMINYSLTEQLKDIFPTIVLSVFAGVLCKGLDILIMRSFPMLDIERLITNGLFYSLIYLTCSIIIKLHAITDFKELIFKSS